MILDDMDVKYPIVVNMSSCRMTVTKICKSLGMSRRPIYAIKKRFEERGTVQRKKSVWTRTDVLAIKVWIKGNPLRFLVWQRPRKNHFINDSTRVNSSQDQHYSSKSSRLKCQELLLLEAIGLQHLGSGSVFTRTTSADTINSFRTAEIAKKEMNDKVMD
ncbi:unnamed protein product [Lepeophtheirus salmonis]|uniref:(salmon louse) hypothetical protein n=1 Tax=Lepeophtheirus salmonis TaxID=72036 RepID=A0A7R8D2T6_LEPSM|nr:unnamed protein product [Lepeophtheirus salmonis]CAF3008277.1 unnamed protein product [Lepeophtheirus salmonis]